MKKSFGARTFVYPTPTWVVGTYDAQGKPNLMTAAWAGICCSNPPCVGVSLRKATYSHGNIVQRKAFTINVPSEDQAALADFLGMVSGRDCDKFAKARLAAVPSQWVDAPYAAEFSMVLECKLLHQFELGLHTQFVGEIMDVKADESVLGSDGLPSIEKVRPFVFDPFNQTYHAIGRLLGGAFEIGKSV